MASAVTPCGAFLKIARFGMTESTCASRWGQTLLFASLSAKVQRGKSRTLAQYPQSCENREQALYNAHTHSAMTMSAIARKLEFVDFPREPVDCSGVRGKRQALTLARPPGERPSGNTRRSHP